MFSRTTDELHRNAGGRTTTPMFVPATPLELGWPDNEGFISRSYRNVNSSLPFLASFIVIATFTIQETAQR